MICYSKLIIIPCTTFLNTRNEVVLAASTVERIFENLLESHLRGVLCVTHGFSPSPPALIIVTNNIHNHNGNNDSNNSVGFRVQCQGRVRAINPKA